MLNCFSFHGQAPGLLYLRQQHMKSWPRQGLAGPASRGVKLVMEWTSFKGPFQFQGRRCLVAHPAGQTTKPPLPTRLDAVAHPWTTKPSLARLPSARLKPSLARLPSARLFRFLHAPAGLDDEAIAAHPALRGRCVTAAAVSRQLLIDDSDASRPPR